MLLPTPLCPLETAWGEWPPAQTQFPQRAKEAAEAPHQTLTKDTVLFRLAQKVRFVIERGPEAMA